MVKVGGFRELIKISLNIETNSPLELIKVGFILIGTNSVSPVKDLAV